MRTITKKMMKDARITIEDIEWAVLAPYALDLLYHDSPRNMERRRYIRDFAFGVGQFSQPEELPPHVREDARHRD